MPPHARLSPSPLTMRSLPVGARQKRLRSAEADLDAEAEQKSERKASRKHVRLAAEPGSPAAQQASTAVMSAAAAAFLGKHEITLHEADAPPPCMHLDAAPFPDAIVRRLCDQKGFSSPSAVQAGTWPLAALGRDVLAIAKTGSGKTLGFLLPALARCLREKAAAAGAPVCLIMAPTRELALQIVSEAGKFLDCGAGCRAVAVYGGALKQTLGLTQDDRPGPPGAFKRPWRFSQ